MNWLFPGFLAGAFAVALPLALHLLRRWPRRPVAFPSLRFLAAGSRRTEHWLQRLCRWLVLASRCAIILLLAAVFARPFRTGLRAKQSRAVVVVIDNSFSLQSQARWDALKGWAQGQVGELLAGDQLGLLVMAPQPTWIAPLTTQTARPLQALKSLSPGWLDARVEPALRLAGDVLAAAHADRRQIILLTDHRRGAWAGTDLATALPPGVEVRFPDLPVPIERQAALSTPTLARAGDGLLATVSIRNFTGAQKRTLRVTLNGTPVPIREITIDLAPKEERSLDLNLAVNPDHLAYFRFALDADDLPADDTAYAVWQPVVDGSVLVDSSAAAEAGPAGDFVGTALTATAEVKPALKAGPLPAGDWPVRAVVILRSDATFAGPTAGKLDSFLGNGGSALLFATDGPNETAWLAAHGLSLKSLQAAKSPEAAGEPLQIRDWAMDHPLVTALSQRRIGVLLGWKFQMGWSAPADQVTPIAYWSPESVAIAQTRMGGGTVLVCGFVPDRSGGDWPVSPAFVPFVHQAVAYLFRTLQATSAHGQAGQPLALAGGRGNWQAIDGPGAGQPGVEVSGSVIPMAPGIYEFAHGDEKRLLAVNLSPGPSDPALWTEGRPWLALISKQSAPKAVTSQGPELAVIDAEQQAPLWWWALAAAGILLLTELALANRTAR